MGSGVSNDCLPPHQAVRDFRVLRGNLASSVRSGIGFWQEQVVERRHREHSLSRSMNFGAKPKLGFRWCGVPIAMASTGVISLVALLSFGGYGASVILGRVRPLRNAYQFLSRAYGRLLHHVGHEVLLDPRDTP